MMIKNCCLNYLMSTSATLCWWQCGGTSLSAQSCRMIFFMLSEHLLSRMWHCGMMAVALILLRRVMYPGCILVSVLFFNEANSVALVSNSTMDGVQPKTSPFSTSHPIWVNYKVVSQLSQPISLLFSYLNSARHYLVIELCRAHKIFKFTFTVV